MIHASSQSLRLMQPASRSWVVIGQDVVTVTSVRYDRNSFDSNSFKEAGISLPHSVAGAALKRQAEFFHGRLCARATLSLLGVTGEVGVGLQREPLWPSGVVGSITHSSRLAMAVALPAAQYCGVGIDVEEIVNREGMASIRSTVLSVREIELLRHQRGFLDEAALLTLAFSAKETFFKAVFGAVQRFIDFDAIEIDAFNTQQCCIDFSLNETLCPDWPAGRRGRVGFDLIGDQHVLTGMIWRSVPGGLVHS